MSRYRVIIEESVDDDVRRIGTGALNDIKEKIDWLAVHAKVIPHQALKGNRYKGKFKLRIGDYRIVYSLSHQESIIRVEQIGHRSTIYKER